MRLKLANYAAIMRSKNENYAKPLYLSEQAVNAVDAVNSGKNPFLRAATHAN